MSQGSSGKKILEDHASYFSQSQRPITPARDEDRPHAQSFDEVHAIGDMCDAAFRGNAGELRRLLDLKASAQDGDYDGRTPLHLAACSGSLNCVKLLVAAGADVRAQSKAGATACALSRRHREGASDDVIAFLGSEQSGKDVVDALAEIGTMLAGDIEVA